MTFLAPPEVKSDGEAPGQVLLEKDRSTRSRRWFLTPKSIRTDVICMNPPPRVQRGHVRRPRHSPQRTVSDDRRRGKHDEDCSDSNSDGGLGLRRGCDRRMRSSSLARSRDVPCSGRRKRHIRILRRSGDIYVDLYTGFVWRYSRIGPINIFRVAVRGSRFNGQNAPPQSVRRRKGAAPQPVPHQVGHWLWALRPLQREPLNPSCSQRYP